MHVSCGRILRGRTDFGMANSVKPVEITDANFSAEIGNFPGVAVVDFWAAWCGPCRMQGPILDELAQEYKNGEVKVAKLNVVDNPQTAEKFGVRSIPTLIIFKDGRPVDQAVGVTPFAELKRRVEQVMLA
jgi:thioredoxin 1